MSLKINEQHLGQDATQYHARLLVHHLNELGYDATYCENTDYTTPHLDSIEDADWTAALQYACALDYKIIETWHIEVPYWLPPDMAEEIEMPDTPIKAYKLDRERTVMRINNRWAICLGANSLWADADTDDITEALYLAAAGEAE